MLTQADFKNIFTGEFIYHSLLRRTSRAFKCRMTKLERYHFASVRKPGRENFSWASNYVTEWDDRGVEIYAIDSNGAEWQYKEALLVLVSPLLREYISLRSAGVRRISINLHVEYLRIFSRTIGAEDSLSHLSSRFVSAPTSPNACDA